MPVKDSAGDTTGGLLPLELPGISNLAICRASYEGNLPAIRNAVEQAVQNGKTPGSVVDALDSSGRSALHWACSAKQVAIVKYLLDECEADAKLLDEAAWSPLMIASSVGNAEIVDNLLVALGSTGLALVNAKNESGQTCMHYAASKNHLDVARALLETGHVDVNEQDKYGNTPLHRAASRGHLEMVKLLLSASNPRVNTSAADASGNSALHFACEDDHKEVALTLIQFGFDLDKKNQDEKTPLDLAPQALRRHLEQIHGNQAA